MSNGCEQVRQVVIIILNHGLVGVFPEEEKKDTIGLASIIIFLSFHLDTHFSP